MTITKGRTTKKALDTDLDDLDFEYFDEDDLTESLLKTPSKAAASGGSTILSEDWLAGLAKALDPDNVEEGGGNKHLWTPNVGPQQLAFDSEADELFFGGAAGGGKALYINTLLHTNNGLIAIKDINIGDFVLDQHGNHVLVIAKSDIETGRDCYSLSFENGEIIVASDNHLWQTDIGKIQTTEEIYKEFFPNKFYAFGGVSIYSTNLVNIEKTESVPVVCIQVNSKAGLYLAGDKKVPTHNSDLMLGLALSDLSPHRKAIVFRRSYPELKDIVVRARQILENTEAKFRGGNAMRFDGLPYGKSLELGSVPNFSAAQKYKGRPHDLKLFDELPDIPENVYTFLIGWARTAEEGIPVRVVAAGNPPTNADGEWVIRRWAAWIDKSHPNPAKPGELRWFATLDGNDTEITEDFNADGSKGIIFPYVTRDGKTELIKPKSRTFIPATLDNNPYLANTDYKAILQNMPEPYRSQLLYGDFGVTQKEDIWQVIPTHWVRLAIQRWQDANDKGEIEKLEQSLIAYGLDVAEGGKDYTVLVKMAGLIVQWIEYIKEPDTMKQADMVELRMLKTKRSPIAVDAIGVGLGLSQRLRQKGMAVVPVKVSNVSTHKDITGTFEFMNLRSELWWRMREAFDPTGANPIMIPNDKRLFGELITPRYDVTSTGKIKIQSQDEIKAKLGRSPDTANGLMLALYVSQKRATPLRII